MFGYMGRNVLTGPGRNNWDLALLKDFRAPWFNGEYSTFQFRLETFNTFNEHFEYEEVTVTGPTSRERTAIQPPFAMHVGVRIPF